MSRDLHRVSCKAALYNHDFTKVLLAEYGPNHYGLPGGHVEKSETPDIAIKRELHEEFGLRNVELTRKDFWLHHNGKIILGYVGMIAESTPITVQTDEMQAATWVMVTDIASGATKVRSYSDFIVSNATLSVGV